MVLLSFTSTRICLGPLPKDGEARVAPAELILTDLTSLFIITWFLSNVASVSVATATEATLLSDPGLRNHVAVESKQSVLFVRSPWLASYLHSRRTWPAAPLPPPPPPPWLFPVPVFSAQRKMLTRCLTARGSSITPPPPPPPQR